MKFTIVGFKVTELYKNYTVKNETYSIVMTK